MTARAAVFELLTTDSILMGYGIDADHCWPSQSVDNPDRNSNFIVLRWEETPTAFGSFGRREHLTVWAHTPKELGSDYVPLLGLLNRVEDLLCGAENVVGADGYLNQCDFAGLSADLDDPELSTITKNAAFWVLSR